MEQQFHYYVTKQDGQEAIWFHDIDREKLIIRNFSLIFKGKDPDGKRWSFDIPYSIDLGGPVLESYLSDWTTDLELIRHSIEHYVFTGETKIELNYEDSPTVIILKRISALERTEDVGPGTAYYWKNFVSVTVKPNNFIEDFQPLFGFCDEKQVIREIYEALLRVGLAGYKYSGEYGSDAWSYPPMVFYNKVKSPIIEDFITGKKHKEDEAITRQVTVDHILTIDEDYGALLWDENGIGNGDVDSDDVIEFEFDNDDTDYKIHVPGIYRWTLAARDYVSYPEYRAGDKLDVDKWYRQGLELVKVIRQSLPPNIDLWYCHPYEDPDHIWTRQRLIYNE